MKTTSSGPRGGRAGRRGFLFSLAAAALVSLAVAPSANAVSVVLQDLNSLVTIEVDNCTNQSPAGVGEWLMNGVNQNKLEWFWYRLGASGPEAPINSLGRTYMSASDTNENPGNDSLFVRYGSMDAFHVEVQFLLTGGAPGSGTSDLTEVIHVHNKTSEAVGLHFFEYADFDLGGTPVDVEAVITGGNTAKQRDIVNFTDYIMAETPAISPDLVEVNAYNNTLASLTDAGPTTLSGYTGPMYDTDLTWAFQWDRILGPNDEFIMSKDKNISTQIIPEPVTVVGLLLGIGCLARYVRRRRTP